MLRSSLRLVAAGGVAVAMAAIPAATLFTMPVANATTCPAGEIEDLYTDACTPELSPNVPGGNWPTQPPATGALPSGAGMNQLPEVAGVPCTGANTGQCIGLEESQNVPHVTPHSTLSSSP